MKKKLNRKYLKIIFVLFTVLLFFSSSVFAELSTGGKTPDDGSKDPAIVKVTNFIQDALQLGMTSSFAGIAALLSIIALVLFILLQVFFVVGGVTGNILLIPMPDNIIFNRMSLFDANFINPNSNSPLYAMRTTLSSVYDSFVIIAIAVFTIVAMIIGIKLALSTLAAEKAKYKQAITSWLSGILLLICMKWILAGLFYINENIVQVAFNISQSREMTFNVISVSSIPLVGSAISKIVGFFGGDASSMDFASVSGYLGLVLKYLLEGVGGSFAGSLVAFVVLGQTFTIITQYLKRVFYCLLLGLIAPIIVAVDTLNRSMGKSSQIMNNWFKNLSVTIFTQSFHAIFLIIIIRMIRAVGESIKEQTTEALIIIILTAGLIKFEKLIKQLFGIGDSAVGDLKGNAAQAMLTMGAVGRAGRSIFDNGKKLSAAKKKKAALLDKKKAVQSSSDGTKDGSSSGTTIGGRFFRWKQ